MLAAMLVVSGAGCLMHRPPGIPAVAECPGALVSTDEMPAAFLLRQRLRITSEAGDIGLRLIVRKVGRQLTLVGFTTLGAKAFSVTQEGTETRVTSTFGRAWPIPPRNVLRDLHRTRFLTVPGAGDHDGVVVARRGDTVIVEEWRGRVLRRRTLTGPDDPAAAVVVVEFDHAGGAATARLRNERCGYEATIVTVAEDWEP